MHRPNVVRLERDDALWSTRIETLIRILEALDYDLHLVAVSNDSDSKRADKVIELIDAYEVDTPRTPKRRRTKR